MKTRPAGLASLAALLLAPLAAAAPVSPRVAVLAYAGAGRDPALVSSLAVALRSAVAARGWRVAEPEETERQGRAASMCGEDAECLATIGQRVDSKWVLAFGVGRAGGNTLVSALLVDAEGAHKRAVFTETLTSPPPDLAALSQRVCDVLLDGVSPPPRLAPADVPRPDAPPAVQGRPLEPSPRLRPWAIGTAIGAGAVALAGGTFTVLAQQSFVHLPDVAFAQRPAADADQRRLNLTADILVGVAIAAGVTAVVLFIIDAHGAAPAAVPAGGPTP